MKEYRKDLSLFLFGAFGYVLMEMLWRGHSHWSMALAGGIALLTLVKVFSWLKDAPIYFQAIVGGIIITLIELVFGLIFNLYLGEAVWNYSDVKGNILGQICPIYSVIWCLICVPISAMQKIVSKRSVDGKAW